MVLPPKPPPISAGTTFTSPTGMPGDLRAHRADFEGRLGGAIDGGVAVAAVNRDRVVRLDVSLMDHLGVELAFDDDFGGFETVGHVAALELHVRGDIGLIVAGLRGAQVRMENRRAGLHRVIDVEHRRQHLVLDFDQAKRLLRDMRRGRGDHRHGMAVVHHLVAGDRRCARNGRD